MEKWFIFTAWNSQSAYGFGTEEEAERYCDILNRKREINVYSIAEISADEDSELLAGLDSGRDTDGFRLDEAIAAQAEIDDWQAEEDRRYA